MSRLDANTLNDITDSVIRLHNNCNLSDKLNKLFTKHPNENGMTYKKHWWRAMKLSIKMAFGSVCLFIHSIFPFVCETTGTNVVKELYKYLENHKFKKENGDETEDKKEEYMSKKEVLKSIKEK